MSRKCRWDGPGLEGPYGARPKRSRELAQFWLVAAMASLLLRDPRGRECSRLRVAHARGSVRILDHSRGLMRFPRSSLNHEASSSDRDNWPLGERDRRSGGLPAEHRRLSIALDRIVRGGSRNGSLLGRRRGRCQRVLRKLVRRRVHERSERMRQSPDGGRSLYGGPNAGRRRKHRGFSSLARRNRCSSGYRDDARVGLLGFRSEDRSRRRGRRSADDCGLLLPRARRSRRRDRGCLRPRLKLVGPHSDARVLRGVSSSVLLESRASTAGTAGRSGFAAGPIAGRTSSTLSYSSMEPHIHGTTLARKPPRRRRRRRKEMRCLSITM
jgi:hypothetical protein